MNFLSTQWSTDGSTSSEPMGLCITSIVKTLTDNHTLDDRNHQGHHTTLLLSETLLSTAQASLCVSEVRSLESTGSPCGEFWSQISTCILTGYRLNKTLQLTTWGSDWSCASGFATRLTLCQTFLTMSGFGNSVKSTAWAAISKNGIIGPFWFEDDNERSLTINTERYVQVLVKFWTALGRRREVVRVLQWFQQDGATSHTSNESLA